MNLGELIRTLTDMENLYSHKLDVSFSLIDMHNPDNIPMLYHTTVADKDGLTMYFDKEWKPKK